MMRRAAVPSFFLVVFLCAWQLVLRPGVAAQGAEPLSPDAASSIYWVERDGTQLLRGNADGNGSPAGCVSGVTGTSGIAVDSAAGRIYWIERSQNRLRGANLDCSGATTLVSTLVNADRLTIDVPAGKLYWTENNGTNRLRSANVNGSGVETLFGGLGRPVGVAVDTVNDYVYWTELDSRAVWRGTLGGTNKTMIVPPVDGQSEPLDIAVDPARNRIYWVVNNVGAIYSASLTGSGAGLWLNLPNPRYVAVDADNGRVYWTDWNTHEIRRANGDTSNSQVLFLSTDGVNEPRGVALSYSSSVTCYLLTRSHSGQGDDPVASPNKSTGCSNGQYVAGESITLTATPATGWSVSGWSGTNNDASTSTTNSVTMPAANHAVSVAYVQTGPACFTLTRNHTGQGNNPTAAPGKSTECGTGQYVAGENITLTASPTTGWSVAGWSGTNNDASTSTTNSVTMPAANHTVSVAYVQTGPTCFTLTRNHTGQGNNPVATPGKSTECGTGQYVAGENITLASTPAGGWRVAGWSGTNNDGSTATTNTVIMPAANHTVSVIYEQAPPTCYSLTRSHSGQGNNPVAAPALSAGCGTGQYVAGESITLTATPAGGWRVAGWSGTNNDASTATTNTVTMPAANHVVSVAYEQAPPTCYTLSRSHTGQGNNPVTAPALSAGCGTGQYVAGELIALTATPAGGWFVTGWGGTNNDASTATTNTVTMPAADHAVSVDYQQASPTCYALTRSHTGQGSDPVATPNQSDVCGVGQYVAGESITLTATPATGWRVAGWVGTNNDGSTSASNTLAMPSADHTARVNYVQQSGSQERAVIPFVLYGQPSFLGPLESEPNSAFGQANGPILLNRTYQGFPNDLSDYFYFDLPAEQQLHITMTDITGEDPQLQLFHNSSGNRVAFDQDFPYALDYSASPGRYYVRVVVVGDNNTTAAYNLRVEAAGAN